MKKLLAMTMAIAMSITALASCGKTESDDKDSKETTAATTTAAGADATTVLTTTMTKDETPSGDMKTDGSYTKNFDKSMNSGKYTMELSTNMLGIEIPMKIVSDGKAAYMEVTSAGITMKMYLTDGKLYTINPSTSEYTVEDYVDDIESAMDLNLYDESYQFTKTEATKLDGKDAYAEHFTYSDALLGNIESVYYFDPSTEKLTKLSMLSEGEEVMSMTFTNISDEIDESLLKLPDLSKYQKVEASE